MVTCSVKTSYANTPRSDSTYRLVMPIVFLPVGVCLVQMSRPYKTKFSLSAVAKCGEVKCEEVVVR